MKKKIMIIGASGFLGTKLYELLSKKYDVIGTCHKRNAQSLITLDITKADETKKIVETHHPEIILMPAAMTDVDACEREQQLAYNINVEGAKNVIEAANAVHAKLVYFSTDAVFDGITGNYKETDVPNPVSYYGKTKFEAEKLVIEQCENFLICRIAVLYGFNGNNTERSFVIWAIDNLKNKKPISVFTDIEGTPTLIDDIAIAVKKLIDKNRNGIYHVAGPDSLIRYEMAEEICNVFGFDKSLLKPVTSKKFRQDAPRPKNASLNTEKLKKEGILMHDVKAGLRIMKKQMQEKGGFVEK